MATLQIVDPTSGVGGQISFMGDVQSTLATSANPSPYAAESHEDNLDDYYIPLNGQYYDDDASLESALDNDLSSGVTADISSSVNADIEGGYPQPISVSGGTMASGANNPITFEIMPSPGMNEFVGEEVSISLSEYLNVEGTSFAYGNWGADDVGDVIFSLDTSYTYKTASESLTPLSASSDPASSNPASIYHHAAADTEFTCYIGQEFQLQTTFDASGTLGNENFFTVDYLNPTISGSYELDVSLTTVPGSITWTGAGPDDLWSDGDNWDSGVAPGAGADLNFPSGAEQLKSEDDLGVTLNSITTSDNYDFSASSSLGTNNLTVQQGSVQLDDSATVTGLVTVSSGATLTVGTGATMNDEGAITIDATGTLDDEGNMSVTENASLAVEGRLIVGTSASLDIEGRLTVSDEGSFDEFGQMNLGDTGTSNISQASAVGTSELTVSQGLLLVGSNAALSVNGTLTVSNDASLADYGTCTVNGDGLFELSGLADVGEGATFSIDSGGSATEGQNGVLDNLGNVTVANGGAFTVGGSGYNGGTPVGEGTDAGNLGSIPVTPTTPAGTAAQETAKQVIEVANLVMERTRTIAEVVEKGLPAEIAVAQAAKAMASSLQNVGYIAMSIKFEADLSILYTAYQNNDQQAFAQAYNTLERDAFTTVEGTATAGILAGIAASSSVVNLGAGFAAAPIAALLGAVGGSYVSGLYYDKYLAEGVTAQGMGWYSILKQLFSNPSGGGTSADSGPGGSLNDMGSVTVQRAGDWFDQDTITVAPGATLDVFGQVTEDLGSSLDTLGRVAIEPGGVLDVFSAAGVAVGGLLDDDGAAMVEAGAALDVVGTLDIAKTGSLDISGAAVLEANATYQPLGAVNIQSDGYLGPPVAPGVPSGPVDLAIASGQVVTFAASASGEPAPNAQWQLSSDGGTVFSDIPGATSRTLSFAATLDQNDYEYRVVFTNPTGTVTTSAAKLTVSPAVSSLSLNLSTTSIIFGQSVTVVATLTGAGAGTIPGGTVSFFSFTNLKQALATVPVDASGQATLTTSAFPTTGFYPIVAKYSGDGDLASASATSAGISITAAPVNFTALQLQGVFNKKKRLTSVVLTVKVQSPVYGAAAPSGLVNIELGPARRGPSRPKVIGIALAENGIAMASLPANKVLNKWLTLFFAAPGYDSPEFPVPRLTTRLLNRHASPAPKSQVFVSHLMKFDNHDLKQVIDVNIQRIPRHFAEAVRSGDEAALGRLLYCNDLRRMAGAFMGHSLRVWTPGSP